jgi:hypothetical protein
MTFRFGPQTSADLRNTGDAIELASILQPALGTVQDWKTATQAYYFDQYRFRGFEALHAYSILALEKELCKFSVELVANSHDGRLASHAALDEVQMLDLRKLLHSHATALNDLESVLRRESTIAGSGSGSGFGPIDNPASLPADEARKAEYCVEHHRYYLRPQRNPDVIKKWLHAIIPASLKYRSDSAAQSRAIRSQLDWEKDPANAKSRAETFALEELEKRGKYATSLLVDRWSIFVMALLAGAALLVPMIIMTFRTSRTARLITVSVATYLFSLLVAFGTEASSRETLSVTAAYAAVMVVYIGTATPGA